MEEAIPHVVKATFKAKSRKQLYYILRILKDALGHQNINALEPVYIFRAKIYVLDMDIRLPKTLLRYDFKEAKEQ